MATGASGSALKKPDMYFVMLTFVQYLELEHDKFAWVARKVS